MSPQFLAFFAGETELSWIEQIFGGPVPTWFYFLVGGIIVALIVVFIAVGFFKELKKK